MIATARTLLRCGGNTFRCLICIIFGVYFSPKSKRLHRRINAGLVHLVERRLCNPKVICSSQISSTTYADMVFNGQHPGLPNRWWGFKSPYLLHFGFFSLHLGRFSTRSILSLLSRSFFCFFVICGINRCNQYVRIAQLVEQWAFNPLVRGSSPRARTILCCLCR